jgi:mono/diheme cytochrome c family protein
VSAFARRGAGLALAFVALAAFAFAADGAWLNRVPAAARARQNPMDQRPDSVEAGRRLYSDHCASCHGSEAQGNGRRPALVSPRIHEATDGELAWLLENGNLRKGMPSWSKLPDERRWQIIAYLRSLNSGAGSGQVSKK